MIELPTPPRIKSLRQYEGIKAQLVFLDAADRPHAQQAVEEYEQYWRERSRIAAENISKYGYDKEGYDIEGYDREGYNRKGANRLGNDRHSFPGHDCQCGISL
jgi:hypothetical protein